MIYGFEIASGSDNDIDFVTPIGDGAREASTRWCTRSGDGDGIDDNVAVFDALGVHLIGDVDRLDTVRAVVKSEV